MIRINISIIISICIGISLTIIAILMVMNVLIITFHFRMPSQDPQGQVSHQNASGTNELGPAWLLGFGLSGHVQSILF